MPPLHIETISLETFQTVLSRYADTVPSALAELDTLRYTTIPEKLARQSEGEKFLLKDDVLRLVEWKIKHGTYRPTLLTLVSSNPPPQIKTTTRTAYTTLTTNAPFIPQALTTLTRLRGIGPATASLLLSVCDPDSVPFFSDEVFRWVSWGNDGGEGGWRKRIRYSVGEYRGVLKGVEGLRRRLGVPAVEVERVAFVLGREGVDVGAGEMGEEGGVEGVEGSASEGEGAGVLLEQGVSDTTTIAAAKAVGKQGTKRKADRESRVEGTRRSTRRKT